MLRFEKYDVREKNWKATTDTVRIRVAGGSLLIYYIYCRGTAETAVKMYNTKLLYSCKLLLARHLL